MRIQASWHSIALAFLALQMAFVAAMAFYLGFAEPPPFEKYAKTAAAIGVIVGGSIVLWRLRGRPARPLDYLRGLDWHDCGLFLLAMTLLWLQFVILTWAKAMIPIASGGMWADPILADFESSIFGGDMWRYLPAAGSPIDTIYSLWTITIAGVFAWQFFREGRAVNTLALIFTIGIVGTFGQFLLPSGGPIFYQRLGFGDRFADMPLASHSMNYANYLWEAYSGRYISYATGISAFPSVHVATSAWVALASRHWAGWAYFALIFVGSIILGWHYAVDGVVGFIGAALCYELAQRSMAVRPAAASQFAGAA